MNDDSPFRAVTDAAFGLLAAVFFVVLFFGAMVGMAVFMLLFLVFITAWGSVIGLVAVVDMVVSGIVAASNALMGRAR